MKFKCWLSWEVSVRRNKFEASIDTKTCWFVLLLPRTFWEPLVDFLWVLLMRSPKDGLLLILDSFFIHNSVDPNMMSLVKFLSDEYRLSWLASWASWIKTLQLAFTLLCRLVVFSGFSYVWGCEVTAGFIFILFTTNQSTSKKKNRSKNEGDSIGVSA